MDYSKIYIFLRRDFKFLLSFSLMGVSAKLVEDKEAIILTLKEKVDSTVAEKGEEDEKISKELRKAQVELEVRRRQFL